MSAGSDRLLELECSNTMQGGHREVRRRKLTGTKMGSVGGVRVSGKEGAREPLP